MSDVMSSYVTALEKCLTPHSGDEKFKRRKQKMGQYPFIALDNEKFIQQLGIVRGMLPRDYDSKERFEFVDVGCGIGTKLLLAREVLGSRRMRFTGIEYSKPYVKAAQKLLNGKDEFQIIHADALDVDYHRYNVIYFYCPLIDCKKQRQLETRILTTAQVGAYFVANLKQGNDGREKLWGTNVIQHFWGDIIYQKVREFSDSELAALKDPAAAEAKDY